MGILLIEGGDFCYLVLGLVRRLTYISTFIHLSDFFVAKYILIFIHWSDLFTVPAQYSHLSLTSLLSHHESEALLF
jgi:hypothetical protein